MFSDLITRLIRTYVPGAVAAVIGVLALPSELAPDLTVVFTAVIFAVYYLAVAWLEQRFGDRFGWLLGVPKSRTAGE